MKKKDILESIPLVILSIIGVYSIIEVVRTDYIFEFKQYLGLSLLAISILMFFVNRDIYTYIFGLTLLLGMLSIVGFTTSIKTFYFFGIPLQTIVAPILAIFIWINNEKLIPRIQNSRSINKDQNIVDIESTINGFESKFENLSDNEIELRLKKDLIPEAIEALKRIKNERENF